MAAMSAADAEIPPQPRPWLNSLVADHAFLRAPYRNWGVVAPGRVYRSNHPLPWQLREATRRFGLRTIINLRGRRHSCGSDILSRRTAAELGLVHVDAPFESRGAPHKDRILRLAQTLAEVPEPILFHCKSGADRAGLAAGLWLLLQGRPVAEAAAQLTLRHLHIRQGKTGVLDAFFERYAAAQQAGPKPFLEWLEQDYDEAALRREFQANRWANLLVDRVLRRE